MKRLALFSVLATALALPTVGLALVSTAGDGTLAIRNGVGDPGAPVVSLVVSGAVTGHVDGGRILVDDLNGPSTLTPTVTGADRPAHDLPSGATIYAGNDLSFRAIGGRYRIKIFGHGVNLNVVGQGTVRLQGSLVGLADGRYSLNGGTWRSLPALGDVFTLGS
jgi:hypothetical protein